MATTEAGLVWYEKGRFRDLVLQKELAGRARLVP
jgi:hypothetical protein